VSDSAARQHSTGRSGVVVNGGLLWTNLSASHVTWDQFTAGRGNPPFLRFSEWAPTSDGIEIDFTKECLGRGLILVTTPWGTSRTERHVTFANDFKVRAELCTPRYYESTVLVTAKISPNGRQLTVDESQLKDRRAEMLRMR
jgi:phenylacetate-coenzyme A ligase PaaK-like adenylate-forming protein